MDVIGLSKQWREDVQRLGLGSRGDQGLHAQVGWGRDRMRMMRRWKPSRISTAREWSLTAVPLAVQRPPRSLLGGLELQIGHQTIGFLETSLSVSLAFRIPCAGEVWVYAILDL